MIALQGVVPGVLLGGDGPGLERGRLSRLGHSPEAITSATYVRKSTLVDLAAPVLQDPDGPRRVRSCWSSRCRRAGSGRRGGDGLGHGQQGEHDHGTEDGAERSTSAVGGGRCRERRIVRWDESAIDSSLGRARPLGRTGRRGRTAQGLRRTNRDRDPDRTRDTSTICRRWLGTLDTWGCRSNPTDARTGHGDRAHRALPLGRRVLSLAALLAWLVTQSLTGHQGVAGLPMPRGPQELSTESKTGPQSDATRSIVSAEPCARPGCYVVSPRGGGRPARRRRRRPHRRSSRAAADQAEEVDRAAAQRAPRRAG